MDPVQGIRKQFSELSQKQYLKYFYLVRLLHVFAPLEQDVNQFIFNDSHRDKIQYSTSKVIPKCMYDSLVSIHATCCQHESVYFPYWHRWLLIKFEQYLLIAHDNILDNSYLKKEKKRLKKLVEIAHPKKLMEINEIGKLLQAIQKDYKEIIKDDSSSYIPAHYWNLIDHEGQISYPEGFVTRGKYDNIFKNIDQMIRLMWDQDSIFEINFATRYNLKKLTTITENQDPVFKLFDQLLRNSEFWKDPSSEPKMIPIAKNLLGSDGDKYFKFKQHQRRKDENGEENRNKLRFNVFTSLELTFLYGGKGFNHYKNDQILATKRNYHLVYYGYAKSLKTQAADFKKFCTISQNGGVNSMQHPHNVGHTRQFYMLNDASFSVCNPIFFAYHGFIDLLLEHRINTFNSEQNSTAAAAIRNFLDVQPPYASGFRQKFMEAWFLLPQNKKNNTYPVLKWIIPNFKQFKPETKQYVVDTNFTYTQLFLDKKKRNLQNLETSLNVKYKIAQSFLKTIEFVMPDVTDLQKKSGLAVALELEYPSTLESQIVTVNLNNRQELVTSLIFPIFSKGQGARICPNCPKSKKNKLLFPMETVKKGVEDIDQIRINGSFATDLSSSVESTIYLESCLFPKIENPEINFRFITGREKVKIILENSDKKNDINPESVKVYLKVEDAYPKKKMAVTNIKRNPKPFRFDKTGQMIINGTNNFYITSITLVIEDKKQLTYNFPLYSEYSELRVNLSKEKKLGMAEGKLVIGAEANNLTEKSHGFINITNQSQNELKAEEVEPKLKQGKNQGVSVPKLSKVQLLMDDDFV